MRIGRYKTTWGAFAPLQRNGRETDAFDALCQEVRSRPLPRPDHPLRYLANYAAEDLLERAERPRLRIPDDCLEPDSLGRHPRGVAHKFLDAPSRPRPRRNVEPELVGEIAGGVEAGFNPSMGVAAVLAEGRDFPGKCSALVP